ncbi:hypothetical protein GY12_17540 [Micrococcus luteus]|nr:hypothetical protein GY12_17540 [Micrococcus luteus]
MRSRSSSCGIARSSTSRALRGRPASMRSASAAVVPARDQPASAPVPSVRTVASRSARVTRYSRQDQSAPGWAAGSGSAV